MIIEEFIGKEIDSLDRSIVATPETRENLDAFARATSNMVGTMLLTQMAVQYGYILALKNIQDELKSN